MRIWHQSFTVLEDLPAYADTLRKHMKKIARPDTEIVMHGQRRGTYPSDYPGDDLAYSYLFWLHGNQWVAGAIKAQQQGFDAYAMCTMPNPMIREIRTLVDIPITGYGESAALVACQLGQRFTVMTFIEQLVPMYTERFRSYGLGERLAGVAWTGFGFRDVLAGYAQPGPLIERFQEAARKTIRATGADVLIGGSMPLVGSARHPWHQPRGRRAGGGRPRRDHQDGRDDGRSAEELGADRQPARMAQRGAVGEANRAGDGVLSHRPPDAGSAVRSLKPAH